jgi:chromosomal replication initiation ATPase DnaA
MNVKGAEIWRQVSAAFGRLRGERARSLWLGDARPAAFRRGLFTLDVASPAAKAAIDARYRTDIETLFQEMTGSPVRLLTRLGDVEHAPPVALPVASPKPSAPPAPVGAGAPARPDAFVPTAACTLALRSAEHFVLAPQAGWNPLFVYGPAGCGKTELARHVLTLLESAGEVREPLVLSGPALTRDVTRAARTGTLGTLQAGWASADLVVLDEAHRLRGQRRCQAEAGSLISAALSRGARVLILSRHAPREVMRLDDRLRSWFLGGMVVAMAEPDTADRAAVLTAVSNTLDVEVVDGVVPALAGRCPGTLTDAVRTLERAARAARQAGVGEQLLRYRRDGSRMRPESDRPREPRYTARTLQRSAIPASGVGRCVVSALQKLAQRRIGVSARAHRLVGQQKLTGRGRVESVGGSDRCDFEARRHWIGIRIERGVVGWPPAGPESGAAHFVRIRLACDIVGQVRDAARMRRRGPAGKSRHCEIETAPEKVHGARLAEERSLELLERAVGREQDAMKALNIVRVVSRMHIVLRERNRIGDFVRTAINVDVQTQVGECVEQA